MMSIQSFVSESTQVRIGAENPVLIGNNYLYFSLAICFAFGKTEAFNFGKSTCLIVIRL